MEADWSRTRTISAGAVSATGLDRRDGKILGVAGAVNLVLRTHRQQAAAQRNTHIEGRIRGNICALLDLLGDV
jgi:hypothetical protein